MAKYMNKNTSTIPGKIEDNVSLYDSSNSTLVIESEYHSVTYEQKSVDVWMFTNSTEVSLHYNETRFGQIT